MIDYGFNQHPTMSTLHFTLSIGYILVLTFVSAQQTYYITPNASDTNEPCLHSGEYTHPWPGVSTPSSNLTSNTSGSMVPCVTLTEFANQSYTHAYTPSSMITLVFLPGVHHLGSDLQIQNVATLILHVAPTNSSSLFVVMVTCTHSSGFIFEDIAGVSVSGLEFSGCEGNTVRSVDQLTLENCAFQHGGHLNLTSIKNGSVLSSSFSSLTGDGGGAIYVEDSGVTIQDSSFTNNTALLSYRHLGDGGAIVVVRSDLTIDGSSFINNTADQGGGGAISSWHGDLKIHKSVFTNNTASLYGGVISSVGDVTVDMSNFTLNTAVWDGGAIYSWGGGDVIVHSSSFSNNTAAGWGGAICSEDGGDATVVMSIFTNNTADSGGAIYSQDGGEIKIVMSSFSYNTGGAGGAISSMGGGAVIIDTSSFAHNRAVWGGGGAIYVWVGGSVTVDMSTFSFNTGGHGGAVSSLTTSAIHRSKFIENKALGSEVTIGDGGAVRFEDGNINIVSNCTFINNTAERSGGALSVKENGTVAIRDNTFNNNTAGEQGGAIYVQSSTLNSTGSLHIIKNAAMLGVVFGFGSELTFSGSTTISDNYGSVYAFSSNVTFNGYTNIRNNSPISSNQEGGAVASFQSEMVFTGTVELTHNRVNNGSGGAILATGSKIHSYGDTTIAHNTALSGGGIYAFQSELSFNGGRANIRNNTADMRGGGINAVSTTTKLSGGELEFSFIENTAERGGGMCLELNAKLYVIKAYAECLMYDNCSTKRNEQNANAIGHEWLRLEFTNNSADYGGALYVSDDTSSGVCLAITDPTESTSNECFFQALALHSSQGYALNTLNTFFNGNLARVSGSAIFGGLLDRCTVSRFAEIFKKDHNLSPSTLNATAYMSYITSLQLYNQENEISSNPVRVCFCKENRPVCNLPPLTHEVKKGQAFNVSLVAVDQVNNPVPSTVRASLATHDGGLGEGQEIQSIASICTELKYTVTSPHNFEELVLYADGPCKDVGISQTHINIAFLPCSCPVGFNKGEEISNCICDCDPKLTDYITRCSIASESMQRKGDIWITFINTTEQEGFVKYTHCPFDYCKPTTDQVWINLNVDNGADAQCAFNRTGKLCGSCEDGLSLTLGSSRCMSCSNNWLAQLIVFAIAGIALVAFLLVCNLTVAVGTINGLIFYANILVTNRATFFPFETPNFFTVFIAWINLDFGFVTCFFDGMDGYSKTWLQLAFPTYIIFLVAMMIKVSEHSVKFSEIFQVQYYTNTGYSSLTLLHKVSSYDHFGMAVCDVGISRWFTSETVAS